MQQWLIGQSRCEKKERSPNLNSLPMARVIKVSNGPVTLMRIVLVYASAWKVSLIGWYWLSYARGTLGKGCIRFKHDCIRCQGRIQGRWNGWIFTSLFRDPFFLFSYLLNVEIIFDFSDAFFSVTLKKIHPPFQNPGSAPGCAYSDEWFTR